MAPTAAYLPAVWLFILVGGVSLQSSSAKTLLSNSITDSAVGDKFVDAAARETTAAEKLANANCKSDPMSSDDIQLGLDLGSKFLVKSQRNAGNFRYEYNWLTKEETDEDNPVRQAGTLWGLSLLHVDGPQRKLLDTLRKGFQYFAKNSVEYPKRGRMVNYPGQDPQKLGTVALLALSHIEVLRQPELLEAEEKKRLEADLDGYLKALLSARTSKNNFYKFYDGKTGKPFGPTSPYYDGECLLALVKAAKYLGHDHLWPHIKASAEAGWKKNVQGGLQLLQGGEEKDDKSIKDANARLKGYYQWSSMAWYELLGMDDPDFHKYAPRMLEYGEWLLPILRRGTHSKANNGYAFEGIIPAFITAVREGDEKQVQNFGCAIREGIASLHTLQVGHPKAVDLAKGQLKKHDDERQQDERAQGGAQGNGEAPGLRIDTTQHQLHALLMANRLLQKQALI